MYSRLLSLYLFIHFLTESPNRSTSCLFFMMLSSTQEITWLSFPSVIPLTAIHQSAMLLFWYLMPNYFHACSVRLVHQQVSLLLSVVVVLLPAVHFYLPSFDPVTAHLNWKCDASKLRVVHCCTREDLLVFEVTLLWHLWSVSSEEITCSMIVPILSFVSADLWLREPK